MADREDGKLNRRDALAAAGACFAMLSQRALAETEALGARPKPAYAKDSEAQGMIEVKGIHAGKGKGGVKMFSFAGAPKPAHFLIYDLSPGGSEGTHVHFLDNRNNEGSFDEYYYIISGRGQMEIDGEIVPVVAGDHVHTPLEVAHGIENTHPTENLRVFLTFIKRGNEPSPMRRTTPQG